MSWESRVRCCTRMSKGVEKAHFNDADEEMTEESKAGFLDPR